MIGRSVAPRIRRTLSTTSARPTRPDVGHAEVVRGERVAAVVERLDAGAFGDLRGEAVVRAEGDERPRLGEACS